jgi:hypothetical protein
MEGDLRPLSAVNVLFKFADDTNLLVPEITDIDIAQEFNAIVQWAAVNRMILNLSKTKEIVFRRPSARRFHLPDPIPNVEQVITAKLLGVTFSNNLKFDSHINNILTICNQRCYLLRQLKAQGLPIKHLHMVFVALIISRITYALPAWGGFLSAALISKLDSLLSRALRWGYTAKAHSLKDIQKDVEKTLFKAMQLPSHCANQLLPEPKPVFMVLRDTHCMFTLPQCNDMYKKSFVIRHLFKDAY